MSVDEILREFVKNELRRELPIHLSHLQPDKDAAEQMKKILHQEYLTKRQLALYLQVSETHIDNMMADDVMLPVARIGKAVRFKRTAIDEYVREKGRRRRLRIAS